MELDVHPCKAELLPEVAALVSRAFLASPIFAGIDDTRYGPDVIEPKLRRGHTLVAFASDRMLGSITLFPPDPESPCEAFRISPQLGLLAVDPTAGGRGIGRRLIAAAELKVIVDGHSAVALSVTQRAPALIALYTSLGFQEVATFHWPQVIDASQIMVKDLALTGR